LVLEREYVLIVIFGEGILHFGGFLNPRYLVIQLGTFQLMIVISL
jgi:hypothetical protein